MSLSSELISQFAKITNDEKPKKSEEATLYGEVVELEEMICVRFDGAEELTPVTTIVEKDDTGEIINYKYGAASVKSGDRVSVSLKNHSATITGNLSDPPAGRAEFIVGLDTIVAKIGDDVQLKLDGVEKSITAQVESTNVRIDNMGVTISNNYTELSNAISSGDSELSEAINALNSSLSQDISDAVTTINGKINVNTNDISTVVNNLTALKEGFKDGTTVISGGCITTGMIDAKYLNLTGAITFVDLNAETQGKITDAESTANSALSTANGAASTASSALSAANSAASDADSAYSRATTAINNAKKIANGTYSGGTFIDGTSISSPVIVGGELFALDRASYAQMTSNGLYMYTDGHTNPKAMLTYSSTEASNPNVEFILGAGSSNDSDYKNRFFIKKGTDRTGLYYYDSKGNMSGLTFMANSKIEVHGTGIGTSTTATAVFG